MTITFTRKLTYRSAIIFVAVATLMTSHVIAMENYQNHRLFDQIFLAWVDAFNHKNLAGSCNLFSKNLLASYQGVPPKNYYTVCNGFKKIFHETRDYQYHFKLHQIYRANDLAAVRITWYLRISEQGKLISTVQDEGLDIFKQNKRGEWKIINYLGYPKTCYARGESRGQ